MISEVYSIRDVKAKVFSEPNVCANEQVAVRGLAYHLGGNSIISQFPDDFALYKIGEFDGDSGKLIPCDPVYIVSARDVAESLLNKENEYVSEVDG